MGAYKRKTNHQTWNDVNMQLAIEVVRGKVMELKRAVKQFGVPRSTLRRRCKRMGDVAVAAENGLGTLRLRHQNGSNQFCDSDLPTTAL